jgi:hyaluronoglucosaminidase
VTLAALAVVAGLVAVGLAIGDNEGSADGVLPGSDPGSPSSGPTTTARPPDAPLPAVLPTPHQIAWLGPDVAVPDDVVLHAGDGVDEPTRQVVQLVLQAAGAKNVAADDGGGGGDDAVLDVWLGTLDRPEVADGLRRAGVELPQGLGAEGYALAALADDGGDDARPELVLGGVDGDGLYYAAQTLRQLVNDQAIYGVSVVDQPSMARRGVVEGFYGSPWTQAERLDQVAFYGDMKMNTYVYAPKADPYHRDRWRDPYPAEEMAQLREVIDAAAAHHVRFTFAIAPGLSMCFSDPDEVSTLETKLGSLYDQGVRDFAIALDDIDRDDWHCGGDRSAYGARTGGSEAQAQVDLLNELQSDFVGSHEGTRPLVMVPTEYQGTGDSDYRSVLREQLDPAVSVMWTGKFVVPAEITADQASAAQQVFGRPTFVWDNFPVDDYARTEGRLLLGPYARREPGIDQFVTGIASNPMNQAAASKVALVGVADFTWNPGAYDPDRAHRAAAQLLAGGSGDDAAPTVDALLAFFDVENLAPTSSSSGELSQGQAPALAAQLDTFRTTWSAGDKSGALAALRPYAERLAGAPAQIRSGVADAGFVADSRPWLDALDLWGQALLATLDGLQARVAGDTGTADAKLQQAGSLAGQAAAVRTVEGETMPQGPVQVGDGVLDTFIADASSLG